MTIIQKLFIAVFIATISTCMLDAMEPEHNSDDIVEIDLIAQRCFDADKYSRAEALVNAIEELRKKIGPDQDCQNVEKIAKLVKAGLDKAKLSLFDLKTDAWNKNNWTAMAHAVSSGNITLIKILLAVAEAYGEGKGYEFMLIASGDKIGAAQIVVCYCEHRNQGNVCTCLQMLKLLLDYAKREQKLKDFVIRKYPSVYSEKANLFEMAAMHGDLPMIEMILNQFPDEERESIRKELITMEISDGVNIKTWLENEVNKDSKLNPYTIMYCAMKTGVILEHRKNVLQSGLLDT